MRKTETVKFRWYEWPLVIIIYPFVLLLELYFKLFDNEWFRGDRHDS